MPPGFAEGSSTGRIQIIAPATWLESVEDWRAKQRPTPNISDDGVDLDFFDFLFDRLAAEIRGSTPAAVSTLQAYDLSRLWL